MMQRRSLSAYLGASGLDVAATVPGPQQGVVAAAAGITSFVNSIMGNSHKFGGSTYEGAEQARADAGALGCAAGSVQAARYLLEQNVTNTSQYAKSATAAAIVQATAANPAVMMQAKSTPLTDQDKDQPDGSGVLGILWQYKIPFTDPYAGYSTSSGAPGSATAMQLANELRQLPPLSASAAPAVNLIPGAAGGPIIPTALPGIPNAITLVPQQAQNIATQIASGAMSVSQLASLGAGDLQLIADQLKAIQSGNIPPGGLSVFVQNNKPLVYGGAAVLALVVGRKVLR